VSSPIPILIAPTRAAGPVIAINSGTTSRVWFIDPAISAVTDSIDLPEIVRSATMTTDGTRVFVMLANGDLVATIVLGGGVTTTRMAPGDTLMYALTSVGVIFEVDVRALVVKRQIIANVQSTDFVIARDGLFYLLDGPGGLVRLFNIQTQTTVRSLVVSTASATINVTPDGQQIWLTQNNPGQITMLTGNSTNGFIFTGSYFTGTFNPTRIAFSPTGSLAAIGNFGGFVDIIR
jgi:DNA-binding beta-propeller fold protein YncE